MIGQRSRHISVGPETGNIGCAGFIEKNIGPVRDVRGSAGRIVDVLHAERAGTVPVLDRLSEIGETRVAPRRIGEDAIAVLHYAAETAVCRASVASSSCTSASTIQALALSQ